MVYVKGHKVKRKTPGGRAVRRNLSLVILK